jgi:multiple sugar transport system substrate-binding protein
MKIQRITLTLRILRRQVTLFLLLFTLVACEGLPELPFISTSVEATATEAVGTATPAVEHTGVAISPVPEETDQAVGVHLKIWLPQQFDPNAGTPAGELLKARLEEFQSENPHVSVEVRLKAITGTGGLLDSLMTANAAAPLALPDLIALPQSMLESAVFEGLIYPFDGLTTAMDDHEWYGYARQFGRQQNSIYGLPFAGDALTMAYRPLMIETPPHDWDTTSAITGTLAFPAADPQALFTMVQYLAAGGAVQNEQGQPILEEKFLVDVLNFFQTAGRVGVMPYWLAQFENHDEVWEAFSGRQASMATSWFSSYLHRYEDLPIQSQLAILPTKDGEAFTLATGWVWAIASSRPDRYEMSARLAEYLLEDAFLGPWTFAAGYLPPHSGALDAWRDEQLRNLVNQIQESAQLLPPSGVIAEVGPLLMQATVDVLKEQADPVSAAKTALENLGTP